jgi:hypothetical protein
MSTADSETDADSDGTIPSPQSVRVAREAELEHLRQTLIAYRYCPPDDKRVNRD